MAQAPARRRGVLDYLRIPTRHAATQRVIWPNDKGELEHHGVDLLGQSRSSALGRRRQRSNHAIVSSSAAVFAAVRWREQAITRPALVLLQSRGGEWDEVGTLHDPNAHPALAAMRRINEATTTKQGIGGIERGKLTNGDHFWIKRRDRAFNTPREFEVWDGSSTWAVPRADRPWAPAYFEHREADGRTISVAPEDAIWFRHIVDPTNPMRSLTPIAAVRVSQDTSHEAMRSNQRYFDQGIGPGGYVMPADDAGGLGPAEIERLREELSTEWVGTDNEHRWHVLESALKILATPQTNRDLQWADLMKWGLMEVARAFEVSPITLKDFEHATYTNADQASMQDWETIRNQLDATVEELNEFYIRPDFGDDFRLEARYAGIGALQDVLETAARVDDIRLKGGYATINELRHRDGKPPVEWGDRPIMPTNMAPLGSISPNDVRDDGVTGLDESVDDDAADDGRALRARLALIDQADAQGWGKRRLKNELRALEATMR
ncbi:MAG: phage portal protein [Gemmatimonadales bacterium]|nr:phage portal protein [Gemmatimonadales bacterium]